MSKPSKEKLDQIQKMGYSIDIVWILLLVQDGHLIDDLSKMSPKMANLCTSVVRKGLVVEYRDALSPEGEELLKFFSSEEKEVKLVKKKPKDDNFAAWWSVFPGTDSFKIGNKEFVGTRALKAKKDDCKEKFNKILSEGEYTLTEMIAALQLEVSQKMQNSLKTGSNKLSFMQNSSTYLTQRTFEPFVELIRAGHKIKEEKAIIGSVDI